MDCPKTESGEVAVACLPDDSLVDILSRLPAKPLFRFKCVSKDWCGLITDRLRCRKFPQTLAGFFAGVAAEKYGAFIGLSESPVPLVNPSFSFLTMSPEIEKIVLLGSCNGLVLFGHRRVSDRCYSLGYIVCNPATEEWVSVPSSGYTPSKWDSSDSDDDDDNEDYPPDTYLIFDPDISPHFQLIELRSEFLDTEHVLIFTSATGAWRLEVEVGLEPDIGLLYTGASVGCSFNGILHVCARQSFLPKENQNIILAVGGEGRPFRTLHWPIKDRGFLLFIGQSRGHLYCLSCLSGCETKYSEMTELSIWVLYSEMTELSIWVLEDYNAEKWVLRDNVSFSQLFGTMSSNCHNWDVLGIHPYRGLVFFADCRNCRLISYDIDKKEVCALCSLHGYGRTIIPYVPYFAQSAALTKKR